MLITIIKDPANISNHEACEVSRGTLLSDWLIDRYGSDGFSVPTRIFAGGVSGSQELDVSDYESINKPITSNIFIVHSPLGIMEAATFVTSWIFSAAVQSLVPIPKLPTGERQDRKSPNNSLSGQSNIARPLERVPDIFGTVKSYPDLIAPTVFEYIDHVLFATEYMCIGRGYYDVAEIRSGNTLVSGIVGSSAQVYAPGSAPTEVLKTTDSNEVKSLTLNPPNDSGVVVDDSFIIDYFSGTDTGRINGPSGIWNDYTIGSSVTLSDVYFNNGATELSLDGAYVVSGLSSASRSLKNLGVTYNISANEGTILGNFSAFTDDAYVRISDSFLRDAGGGSASYNINGYYRIKTATASSIVLESVTAVNSNWSLFTTDTIIGSSPVAVESYIDLNNASTVTSNWTDSSLPENALEILTITDSRVLKPLAFLPDEVLVRGPFIVPGGNKNDEVWLDFSAPRGLASNSNNPYTVLVDVTFEETDEIGNPLGPEFTVNYSFTDDELNPRYYTRKVTSADGLESGKYYRVSAERVSNTNLNSASLVDQITWTRLSGIQDITNADTSGTTRVQIKTQAKEQTSSLQDRKFNMLASRKVVTWNGSSVVGDISTGAGLSASSRMADIFLHYCLDPLLAKRDITNVDVNIIFDIQANLDSILDGKLGEFNYTFDNQNTPALEELRQIANAARCFVFREGSILSMVRDEKQTISRALFNRRNKIPESETKTITFNKPLDYDGVQLEYRDGTDNTVKTIILPNDLPVGDPNYNLPNATNPLKVEATGVTNTDQAWNRAQYELNRIIHSRVRVETKVTEEGILLPLNARIEHVDGTSLARVQSNGEITGVNGMTITTSERCIFESGKTYSVILRNDEGTPDLPISVTARSDTEFGFILATAPSFTLFVRGENDYQVGTLYNFAPDGDEYSNSYLVQRKQPDENGNVTLELINYTDKYYQADEEFAPELSAFDDGFNEGFS